MQSALNTNQLRKHLKYTFIHYLKRKWWSFKLGTCNEGVYIDRNVKFLRFPENIFIDKNVVIKEGTRICACNVKAQIRIGKNTTIGYHTFIFSSDCIEIGDDCLIAPFVYIVDSNHSIDKEKKINAQPNITSPISIGNDVWIASNVTILKGVRIGNGAVIAANSVVNQNVDEYTIVGGSPAKVIGKRE